MSSSTDEPTTTTRSTEPAAEDLEVEQPTQVVELTPLQEELARLARELGERFGIGVKMQDPENMRFLALMAILERKGIASLAELQTQMDEAVRDQMRAVLTSAEAGAFEHLKAPARPPVRLALPNDGDSAAGGPVVPQRRSIPVDAERIRQRLRKVVD